MITFRPHHFLCTLCFQGKGYSPDFVRQYKGLVAELDGEEATPITVVEESDQICQPCPHRRASTCEQEVKIQALDRGHAKVMAWKVGETLTWKEAKDRMRQHLSLDQFHEICAPCAWKPYGICEKIIRDFLKES